MSTRSSIAVQHADGTVSAVYCHFDGYLEGVGQALLDHHPTFEAAASLVALGDLSQVSQSGEVVAYSRDKGEAFEGVAPKKYPDLDTYFLQAPKDIGDNGYRYLFTVEWKVWGTPSHMPMPVGMAITKALSLKEDT